MNAIINAYQNNQDLSPYATASHVDLFDALMWACEHNAVPLWDFLKTTALNPLQAQGLPLVVAIENQSFEMVERLASVLGSNLTRVLRYFLWTKRNELHALTNPTTRAQYLSVLLPYAGYQTTDNDLAHMFIVLTAQECKMLHTSQHFADEFLKGLTWLYDLHKQIPTQYPDPADKTMWVLSEFSFDKRQDVAHLMKCACNSLCIQSLKEILKSYPKFEIHSGVLSSALSRLSASKALDLLEIISQSEFSDEAAQEVVEGVQENRFMLRIYNFDHTLDQRVITTLIPYLKKIDLNSAKRFWEFFVEKSHYKMMVWFEEQKSALGLPDVSWDDYKHIATISYTTDSHFKKYPQLHQTVIINKACVDSNLFGLPAEYWLNPEMFDSLVASGNVALVEKVLAAGAMLSMEHFEILMPLTDDATIQRLFTNHILSQYTAQYIVEKLEWTQHRVINFLNCDVSALNVQNLSTPQQTSWLIAALRENRWDWLEKIISTNPSINNIWEYIANYSNNEFLTQALDIALRHCDPWDDNSQSFIEAVKANNLQMAKYLAPHCDPASDNSNALCIAIKDIKKNRRKNPCNLKLSTCEESDENQVLDNSCEEMVDFLLQYCNPRANNAQALKTALYCNLPNTVVKLLAYFPSVPQLSSLGSSEQELLDLCIAQKQSKVLRSTVQTAQDNTIEKKRRM